MTVQAAIGRSEGSRVGAGNEEACADASNSKRASTWTKPRPRAAGRPIAFDIDDTLLLHPKPIPAPNDFAAWIHHVQPCQALVQLVRELVAERYDVILVTARGREWQELTAQQMYAAGLGDVDVVHQDRYVDHASSAAWKGHELRNRRALVKIGNPGIDDLAARHAGIPFIDADHLREDLGLLVYKWCDNCGATPGTPALGEWISPGACGACGPIKCQCCGLQQPHLPWARDTSTTCTSCTTCPPSGCALVEVICAF